MLRAGVAASIACAVAAVAPANAATGTVDVRDNEFVPSRIEVTAGDTVRWSQSGSQDHTVTSDDGSFDSHPDCGEGVGQHTPATCLSEGETFEHAFTEAGEFPYYCKVHGRAGGIGMAGVVVVEAPAASGGGGTSKSAGASGDETSSEGAPVVESEATRRDSLPRTGVPAGAPLGAALVGLAAGAALALRRRR